MQSKELRFITKKNLTIKNEISFYEARKSVKKRIKETHDNTYVEQEDEANIFDILQNM